MNDPLLESIARMRHRPAMYIGLQSAEAMFLYLQGYCNALQDHSNIDLAPYRKFIDALYEKYGYGGGGDSWAKVLGKKTGGDAAALDLFFDELDAFRHVPVVDAATLVESRRLDVEKSAAIGPSAPPTLEELLQGVTEENRQAEWNTGPAVGRERIEPWGGESEAPPSQ